VYQIRGRVIDPSHSLGGSSVQILLEGAKHEAKMADGNGQYTFSDLPEGGNYTVTAVAAPFIFTQTQHPFDKLSRNETADFTVAVFKISGRVTTANNQPAGKIKVSIEGSKATWVTTDDNGYYSFDNLRAGGSYNIIPRGQEFEPKRKDFDNLQRDEPAEFTIKPEFYKISGRVTPNQHSFTVEMELEGSKHSLTKADANGNYTFSGLQAGGTYTVTLRRVKDGLVGVERGLHVAPSRYYFESLRRNESAANFTIQNDAPPTPGCLLESQTRDRELIMEWFREKGWRNTGGYRGKILGTPQFQGWSVKGCTASVTVLFEWQSSAEEKLVSVEKQRNLVCEKTDGEWFCHSP
jgi:hypothetical protein